MAPPRIPLNIAIPKRIAFAGRDECWLWMGQRDKDGYGTLSRRPLPIRVHRWMWEQVHGPIPSGLQIRHACDNPPCVNPAHMSLGTSKDNKHDSVRKDRHARGAIIGTSVLTEELVQQIRATKGTLMTVAVKFGVHWSTIARIRNRTTWKHL